MPLVARLTETEGRELAFVSGLALITAAVFEPHEAWSFLSVGEVDGPPMVRERTVRFLEVRELLTQCAVLGFVSVLVCLRAVWHVVASCTEELCDCVVRTYTAKLRAGAVAQGGHHDEKIGLVLR